MAKCLFDFIFFLQWAKIYNLVDIEADPSKENCLRVCCVKIGVLDYFLCYNFSLKWTTYAASGSYVAPKQGLRDLEIGDSIMSMFCTRMGIVGFQ